MCRAKIVEKCRKTFWHFSTIFDVFCPARNLSKSVENIFDTFWRFLTFFDVAPFRRPLLQSAEHCELKHWNFGGWKGLIHGLHFTVWPPPPQFTVGALFLPLIHGLCTFFRLLLTPVSTAPSWPASQFTVCASRLRRLRAFSLFLLRFSSLS